MKRVSGPLARRYDPAVDHGQGPVPTEAACRLGASMQIREPGPPDFSGRAEFRRRWGRGRVPWARSARCRSGRGRRDGRRESGGERRRRDGEGATLDARVDANTLYRRGGVARPRFRQRRQAKLYPRCPGGAPRRRPRGAGLHQSPSWDGGSTGTTAPWWGEPPSGPMGASSFGFPFTAQSARMRP